MIGFTVVASRQIEIPFHRDIDRQRQKGFSAPAHVFGRAKNGFMPKCVVPARRQVGTDLMVNGAPEISEIVVGERNFKTVAKSVERPAEITVG